MKKILLLMMMLLTFCLSVSAEGVANSGSFVRGGPLTLEDLCIGGVYYGQPFSEVPTCMVNR